VDEQRRNAFLVARSLLEHGEGAIDGSAATAIAAVVLYDCAVETAAKATLAAHRPRSIPGAVSGREHLPGVLDQLLAAYRQRTHDSNAELPGLADARQLHHYRNGVQHAGTIPSPDDLVRQRLRASDFIDSLASHFFDMRLAEISRTSLIQVEHARDEIDMAERALGKGELDAAARHVAMAVWIARDALCERRPTWPSLSRTRAERAVDELRSVVGQSGSAARLYELGGFLGELARRTAEVEDALSLGSLASEYAWFRRRFPEVRMESGVLVSSHIHGSPADLPMTREDLVRAIAFAVNATLQWQRFPPAPRPDPEPSREEAADGGLTPPLRPGRRGAPAAPGRPPG
jgi:hypothetical protein